MTALQFAVFIRAGWRCAFCACNLAKPVRVADEPTVCALDVRGDDSSIVASCMACAGQYARHWPNTCAYSVEAARRILGLYDGHAVSGPFVDYLESCVPAKLGIRTPFSMALARIEAQRHQELDLVAGKRLARKAAA
jgi:hypothetical protein